MADALATKIRCVVVTPEKTELDETADFVVIPAYDGELGVMLNAASVVARLAPGEMRLTSHGQTKRFFVDGGFGQVHDNVVTVLTSRARSAESLNANQLRQELEGLNAQVPTTEESLHEKQRKLRRVRVQLGIATKVED